jgi:WD40 repeat protein
MVYMSDHSLFITGLGDGAQPRLLHDLNTKWSSALAWSPDDRWIVVGGTSANHPPEIDLFSPDGRESNLLADHSLADRVGHVSVVWTGPDRLVYARYGNLSTELIERRIDPATGTFVGEPVSRGEFPSVQVDVEDATPDGKQILASFLETSTNLFVSDLSENGNKASAPRRVSDVDQSFAIDFSEDSSILYFSSTHGGAGHIYRVALATGVSEPITPGNPFASFSEGKLLFARSRKTDAGVSDLLDVVAVDLASKQETVLGQVPRGDGSLFLTCARASLEACIYTTITGSELHMRRWSPKDGLGASVGGAMVGDTAAVAISMDGKRLALSDGFNPLRFYDLTPTGAPVEASAHQPDFLIQALSWMPDGTLVATGMGNSAPVYRLAHLTTKGDAVDLVENTATFIERPVVSPDGKHVAFTQMSMSENLWLLTR